MTRTLFHFDGDYGPSIALEPATGRNAARRPRVMRVLMMTRSKEIVVYRCHYCNSPTTLNVCLQCELALDRASVMHLRDLASLEVAMDAAGLPSGRFESVDEFIGYLGWKVQEETT